jgi:hypothetical protein
MATKPAAEALAPRVWYVLQAKRDDSDEMEKVLKAAMEAARRSGTSRALELLSADVNTPQATPFAEHSPEPDYRVHEARRWADLRAAFLSDHESVTAPELSRLTGSRSANPSARAHSWVKSNRIFAINDGTCERYPLFQLREGQPIPQVGDILSILKPRLSNWQIALWFASPNAWVGDWRRPIDVLADHPQVVVDAARHEVAEHEL